ncbi:similar to tRNA (guanine-N(1)-)-methyltransferase [Plenodomus lingam JN3]|uniref:tRNA (guanine(37)-N1)-methyltransferase n=1 Tax=Leptosphaeria maculans (strain JN3 / isolate v23.1.3 / race Av1-4-5-6-7-8) TaxID=985895 RepID=E4ZV80_LEPMJ|nr:similar to tRNA (guanine-N(1)-)-methyltransferase [Plenodomus lingam JN3]CBX95506.1 similar to tRNA (guanine-N(1)-)-methyltransferase [Plenodomus lingam JN3]
MFSCRNVSVVPGPLDPASFPRFSQLQNLSTNPSRNQEEPSMSTPAPSNDDDDDMFAAPVNRAMKVLDRSFFRKTIPTSAARIFNPKDISRCRKELTAGHDTLPTNRVDPIRPDPDTEFAQKGTKCLLLRPEVVHSDRTTWSNNLRNLEQQGTLGVIPYQLQLDYDYFTYSEITSAIIPAPEKKNDDEIPQGFALAGHVAHLNLRERYWPYKHLIATVLADKNPSVKTVINKLDNVGSENAFRTFQYEVLHGPDDLNVELREQGCTFRFDFAQVYWNTRLQTEHERLCSLFQEGEAICDVMAGVGPFAVPAGKKKCFVWANDLNPESFKSLQGNIKINKVGDYVQPFNTDGGAFIKQSAIDLLKSEPHSVPIYPKTKFSRSAPETNKKPEPLKTLVQPRFFSHYVMNLPASAITFLPNFIGLYANVPGMPAEDIKKLLAPHTSQKLPMIHVHCFSTKSEDNLAETKEICAEISRQIGHDITPDTPEVTIWDVRDVAPKKRMFCASFRLPEEVAFRHVSS